MKHSEDLIFNEIGKMFICWVLVLLLLLFTWKTHSAVQQPNSSPTGGSRTTKGNSPLGKLWANERRSHQFNHRTRWMETGTGTLLRAKNSIRRKYAPMISNWELISLLPWHAAAAECPTWKQYSRLLSNVICGRPNRRLEERLDWPTIIQRQ